MQLIFHLDDQLLDLGIVDVHILDGFEPLFLFIEGQCAAGTEQLFEISLGLGDFPRFGCSCLLRGQLFLTFTGIDPSEILTNAVLPNSLVEGRYLVPNDEFVALIDKEYAQINNLSLGSIVTYVKEFEVVGIVDVSATNIVKSHIYANLNIVQEVLPEKPVGLVNIALIRTSTPNTLEVTTKAIENKWPDSSTLTEADLAETVFGLIKISENTAWNISIILIIVTILFAIKSHLGSIGERTKELGILKAIGWSNVNVMNQIFIESIIQGIIGGALGCILGSLLS